MAEARQPSEGAGLMAPLAKYENAVLDILLDGPMSARDVARELFNHEPDPKEVQSVSATLRRLARWGMLDVQVRTVRQTRGGGMTAPRNIYSLHLEPDDCAVEPPDGTDGCPSPPRTTTDIRCVQVKCLSIRLNKSKDMRLMETIEDGSKAQIVLEDISPQDADAIHAFQLAQGRGRLVISESGIRYEDP